MPGYIQRLVTRSTGRRASPESLVAPSRPPSPTGPAGFIEEIAAPIEGQAPVGVPAVSATQIQQGRTAIEPALPASRAERLLLSQPPQAPARPGPVQPPTRPPSAPAMPEATPTRDILRPTREVAAGTPDARARETPRDTVVPRPQQPSMAPSPAARLLAEPLRLAPNPPKPLSPPVASRPLERSAPSVIQRSSAARSTSAQVPVTPRPAAVPPPVAPRGPSLQIGRIEVAVQAPAPTPAAVPRRVAPPGPRGVLSGSPLLGHRFGFGQS